MEAPKESKLEKGEREGCKGFLQEQIGEIRCALLVGNISPLFLLLFFP